MALSRVTIEVEEERDQLRLCGGLGGDDLIRFSSYLRLRRFANTKLQQLSQLGRVFVQRRCTS